jgi:hypothetical protein
MSMPYTSAKYRWTLVYIAAVVTALLVLGLFGVL